MDKTIHLMNPANYLITLARHGDQLIPLAEHAIALYPCMRIHEYLEVAIVMGAMYGQLEYIQFLYGINPSEIRLLTPDFCHGSAFICASMYGHQHVVEWLFSLLHVEIMANEFCLKTSFLLACVHGHMELAEWLFHHTNPLTLLSFQNEEGMEEQEEQLRLADMMASYSDSAVLPLWNGSRIPLIAACKYGHLNVAIWLYSQMKLILPDSDFPGILQEAMVHASHEGHQNITTWIYAISRDTIDLARPFEAACIGGHLELAQAYYSYASEHIMSRIAMESIFQQCCAHGHLFMIRWIYRIYPELNVADDGDIAYRMACENGHIHIVVWFYRTIHPRKYRCYQLENGLLLPSISFTIEGDVEHIDHYDSEEHDCSICTTTRSNIKTCCGHRFCMSCIMEWTRRSEDCPLCRSNLMGTSFIAITFNQ